jgi:Flp pilus assembly protein TadG
MARLATVATRGERGQAIIELALTLPLLLLIVLGIFDFGLMFQKYEVVTNAAREGARVGVLPGYSTTDAQARALQYMAVGGLTGTPRASCGGAIVLGRPCASGALATTVITGSDPPKSVEQITMTVEYDYQYRFVGPIVNTLFGGSLGSTRLRAVSTMRVESN